jgi:hypothetical protein
LSLSSVFSAPSISGTSLEWCWLAGAVGAIFQVIRRTQDAHAFDCARPQ